MLSTVIPSRALARFDLKSDPLESPSNNNGSNNSNILTPLSRSSTTVSLSKKPTNSAKLHVPLRVHSMDDGPSPSSTSINSSRVIYSSRNEDSSGTCPAPCHTSTPKKVPQSSLIVPAKGGRNIRPFTMGPRNHPVIRQSPSSAQESPSRTKLVARHGNGALSLIKSRNEPPASQTGVNLRRPPGLEFMVFDAAQDDLASVKDDPATPLNACSLLHSPCTVMKRPLEDHAVGDELWNSLKDPDDEHNDLDKMEHFPSAFPELVTAWEWCWEEELRHGPQRTPSITLQLCGENSPQHNTLRRESGEGRPEMSYTEEEPQDVVGGGYSGFLALRNKDSFNTSVASSSLSSSSNGSHSTTAQPCEVSLSTNSPRSVNLHEDAPSGSESPPIPNCSRGGFEEARVEAKKMASIPNRFSSSSCSLYSYMSGGSNGLTRGPGILSSPSRIRPSQSGNHHGAPTAIRVKHFDPSSCSESDGVAAKRLRLSGGSGGLDGTTSAGLTCKRAHPRRPLRLHESERLEMAVATTSNHHHHLPSHLNGTPAVSMSASYFRDSEMDAYESSPGSCTISTMLSNPNRTSTTTHPSYMSSSTGSTSGNTHNPSNGPATTTATTGEGRLRLLEYVVHLLNNADPAVRWIQRERRIFQIADPPRLSDLWGLYKKNAPLSFTSVSRSLRLYYKDGTLRRLENQRDTYQILK